jgi:hypothetical protein
LALNHDGTFHRRRDRSLNGKFLLIIKDLLPLSFQQGAFPYHPGLSYRAASGGVMRHKTGKLAQALVAKSQAVRWPFPWSTRVGDALPIRWQGGESLPENWAPRPASLRQSNPHPGYCVPASADPPSSTLYRVPSVPRMLRRMT